MGSVRSSVSAESGDAPSISVLTADVGPITAQTTLQNITGLGVAIGASSTEIWMLKLWLNIWATNQTMDAKLGFTVPAGCTMKWGVIGGLSTDIASIGARSAANNPITLATESTTVTVASFGGNPGSGVGLFAWVYGGGTAGTVQPQYAQGTSDAGNLLILKGSLIEATKIAA